MPRFILPFILCSAIALAGGVLSAHYALRRFGGFGKMQIGAWESLSPAETENADIYSRAIAAQRGIIALGRAEGMSFILSRDAEGKALSPHCRYILRGEVPEARFFTLYPVDGEYRRLNAAKSGLPDKLFSQDIIRDESGAFTLMLAPQPAEGNWLAAPESLYQLKLTLYDTPLGAMIGQAKLSMPQLVKIGGRCG